MIERSVLTRNLALTAVFVLVAWFLWTVRTVLNPLILGYLLAFILHPLVLWLEKRKWRRRSAVNMIFFGFAVLLTGLGFAMYFQGSAFKRELTSEDGLGRKVQARVEDALAEYRDEITWVMKFVPAEVVAKPAPNADAKEGDGAARTTPSPGDGFKPSTPESADPSQESAVAATENVQGEEAADNGTLHFADVARMLQGWWQSWLSEDQRAQATDLGSSAVTGIAAILSRVFGSVLAFGTLLLLLPIYTYFLLFELERIHRFVQRYIPRKNRERVTRVGTQIGEVLATFFRGRLLVCVGKGLFISIALFIADVDFALVLGLGSGFLSLIPFVGPAIGFVMALLVAMLEHSVGSAFLRAGIVFTLAEIVEGYVLLPKILGDSLGLHPIVVIFSLMAGGASMGMFGLLIALPLTATLVILAREFVLPMLAQLSEGESRTTRSP